MLQKAYFLNVLVEENSTQHNFSVFHRVCGWSALWVVIVQQVSGTNWLIQSPLLPWAWLTLPSTICYCQSASVCPDFLHFDTVAFHKEILPLWNQIFKILIKIHFLNSTKKKGKENFPIPFSIYWQLVSLYFSSK